MLTPGEILRNKRKELGKTVFEVSQETRILEKYIKQLENNEFEKFDSPVFAKGFTKIYAEYLNLDVDKLLALFRRENKEIDTKRKRSKNIIKQSLESLKSSSTIPISIITIIFLSVFSYLYFQIFTYQRTPTLTIYTPVNGYSSQQDTVTIQGKTTKGSKILINNSEYQTRDQIFETTEKLKEGENIFIIKSVNIKNEKKYTENTIKVYYQLPQKTDPTPTLQTPQKKSFSITLKISKAQTWIQLNIDNKQKLAQAINPGYTQTFEVTQNLELTTGKPDNTQILIDGKIKVIKANPATGVAGITCNLDNNEIVCSQ